MMEKLFKMCKISDGRERSPLTYLANTQRGLLPRTEAGKCYQNFFKLPSFFIYFIALTLIWLNSKSWTVVLSAVVLYIIPTINESLEVGRILCLKSFVFALASVVVRKIVAVELFHHQRFSWIVVFISEV